MRGLVGFGALVAVVAVAWAVVYCSRNAKDDEGKVTVYGHVLQALVVGIVGGAVAVVGFVLVKMFELGA